MERYQRRYKVLDSGCTLKLEPVWSKEKNELWDCQKISELKRVLAGGQRWIWKRGN